MQQQREVTDDTPSLQKTARFVLNEHGACMPSVIIPVSPPPLLSPHSFDVLHEVNANVDMSDPLEEVVPISPRSPSGGASSVLGVAVDEAHMSLIKIFANEYSLGRHNCLMQWCACVSGIIVG